MKIMKAYVGDQNLEQFRVMQVGFQPDQKARIRAYMHAHGSGHELRSGILGPR